MKILIPIAGASSRFPDMRPKWMLTFPNGELMIERSIMGLNLDFIDDIIIIALRDQINEYNVSIESLLYSIKSKIDKNIKIEFELLDSPTNSQPTTIYRYLSSQKNDFPFFIKDCDNYFEYTPKISNAVPYISLEDNDFISSPGQKSYLRFNKFNEIEQIAEKSIISSDFCCGGYGFLSSDDFINTYKELDGEKENNLYISHIIHKQILGGVVFSADKALNYEDYGTASQYFSAIKNTATVFSDFDGVLVKNSSKFSKSPWSYEPNKPNLIHLQNFLKESPDSRLIITTSRPSTEEKNIEEFMQTQNIKCHSIITDLPHSKRILINDFSTTNPFPSAQSINMPRNSENLKGYLTY